MDAFHWAGLALGAVIAIAGLAMAWKSSLTALHVILVAVGAVLAGVPVITLSLGANPSVQIGDLRTAAAQTNSAAQQQGQAISALNERVTQLASLMSKIPVAAAAPSGTPGQPAPPPVATAAPPGYQYQTPSVLLSPQALRSWTDEVHAFRTSGDQVTSLNEHSRALVTSSEKSLAAAHP